MIRRDDIEIMAPVGSFESLHAAIKGGANSVYFGLEKLNMRARSSVNFTTEDLKEIVRICKEHEVKTYLTLNIVVYDSEMDAMKQLIDAAKENEVSAVIVSDQSAIQYAREKGVEVHISTQLSISNIQTVKFYSLFADVMVTARELDLNQVKAITDAIEKDQIKGPSGELVQIEIFAHGALCMSISGKCYLSLHEQNYSANRGACLQQCRKGYTVTEKETGSELDIENEYIMSPKDLKTIHFLNKIIEAGVKVLKIEGRARGPEYVYTVVKCYNEALHSLEDGTYNQQKIDSWDKQLAKVFNRGFWDGYYLGQRLGEWSHVYGSRATQKKVYVGKCTNFFPKLGVAEILCEAAEIKIGDEVVVTGTTTGIVESQIEEARVDLKPVEKVNKGEKFSIKLPELVRRNDKLYKLVEVPDNSIH
jgi:putative protease